MMQDWLRLAVASYYSFGLLCFGAFILLSRNYVNHPLIMHGKVSSIGTWQLPKRYFAGFYFIGLLCAVSVFEFRLQECMLVLHLMRRLLESIIWPYSEGSTMHAIHALVGFSYYPVLVAAFVLSTSRFVLDQSAVLLFVVLNGWQSYIHYLLHKSRQAGHVPLECWPFRYSLCPHYLAEILIYVLFARCAGWSPMLLFNAAFVTANLSISAISTADWYHRRFPKATQPPALVPWFNLQLKP